MKDPIQTFAEAESRDALRTETKSIQQTILINDNTDNLKETLTGPGTIHKVNGIAIQRTFTEPLLKVDRVETEKIKETKYKSFYELDLFIQSWS